MTEAAQTRMSMHDLYLLTNHNVSKDGEEGKDRRHRRFPVNHKEWHMVNFEPICKVPDTGSSFVGMGNDDDFMAAIDKLL